MTPPPEPRPARVVLSFQTRLNLTLLAAAIIPLAIFGGLLLAFGAVDPDIGERLLLFMFAISIAIGVLGGSAVGLNLVAPLREISTAVDKLQNLSVTPQQATQLVQERLQASLDRDRIISQRRRE